ncbi:hypothetical protein EJ08DRAFT_730916 [Tothia fuscella]|uniref:Uncharacterized protein n=1 Tax=Tothia fuscella TaxID=1048955 RepID=A0A9P4NYZ6_9PEZI|nr:hypothetical protein EJ08DRAFT_730916 [Tothia fuscella]
MGQTFMKLSTQSEIDSLDLDSNTNLPLTEKLELLNSILQQKLERYNFSDPINLSKKDFETLFNISFAISFLAHELKHHDTADALFRESIRIWESRQHQHPHSQLTPREQNCPVDIGALNGLAGSAYEQGHYTEAEKLIEKALPVLRKHPTLGEDAPPVLGTMRLLMHVLGKEGRFEEALELNRTGMELIEGMEGGKFGKYQGEEREEMERVKGVILG